ncbi:C-terminal putative domain protein [Theileria parva strain Muguga]|uniref:C-terminal putative domain protein n=1 Tax=Theileria parva strain Muguga TaxID=333668 RepID=UPI001C6196EE|nr:C-terminal putative domain protein [Theileria parva strain Muguga]EAN32479.2 C-terminal putative domain protein [Theileria parva strain Muguga]
MELRGFVRKFKPEETFNPLKDSKLLGHPVYPVNLNVDDPKCEICNLNMSFLMQLSAPTTANRNRVLYIFYCLNDATKDKGWKLLRYSAEKPSTTEPKFGEMSDLSWSLDSINLNTTETDGLRVILENDLVYHSGNSDKHSVSDEHLHSIVLLEKFRNKSKDEIDEEDLVDFESLANANQPPDSDDDSSIDDDSDDDSEVDAINHFQNYLASRPKTVVRVNRGGNPISFLTDLNLDLSSKVCKLCNSQLHFEVQILPHSIHYMTNDDTSGDSVTTKLKNISLRLGGVLFYTCSSDCNTSTNLSQELSHVLLYN